MTSLRKFATLALLALAFWSLCGSALAQNVTITYFFQATSITPAEEALVKRFNELHPEITVELLPGGNGQAYSEQLAVLRAGGRMPDVYQGAGDKLGYQIRGWTLDLTPYVQRDLPELEFDQYFPGVLDTFTRDGRTYGLPSFVTPQILIYNKDMFDRFGIPHVPSDWDDTGWTWDAFVDASRKLTQIRSDGTYAQVALTQATEAYLPDIVWMFGGDWFAPEDYASGEPRRPTMLRSENVRAYEALVDYYARYAAAGPDKGIDPWSGLWTQTAAMDWIGAWKVNTVAGRNPSFAWGVGAVPLVENRANTRWTDTNFISDTSGHPDAAWEFVKFLASRDGQEIKSRESRVIPARRDAMDAYIERISASSGMSAAEIMAWVGGAIAHSRRSLEESIPVANAAFAQNAGNWFDPMFLGEQPVVSTLETIQGYLSALLAERN